MALNIDVQNFFKTKGILNVRYSQNMIREHWLSFSEKFHNWTKNLLVSAIYIAKHAYSNILKILQPKKKKKKGKFSQKKSLDIFHIFAQNIVCGYSLEPPRRGGSNECPQSMFFLSTKKNNGYPCKPQFYYIKVGFKGVKII